MSARFTEVHGGRFHCDRCGHTWAGSWHGPRGEMVCLVCKRPMYLDRPGRNERPPR